MLRVSSGRLESHEIATQNKTFSRQASGILRTLPPRPTHTPYTRGDRTNHPTRRTSVSHALLARAHGSNTHRDSSSLHSLHSPQTADSTVGDPLRTAHARHLSLAPSNVGRLQRAGSRRPPPSPSSISMTPSRVIRRTRGARHSARPHKHKHTHDHTHAHHILVIEQQRVLAASGCLGWLSARAPARRDGRRHTLTLEVPFARPRAPPPIIHAAAAREPRRHATNHQDV